MENSKINYIFLILLVFLTFSVFAEDTSYVSNDEIVKLVKDNGGVDISYDEIVVEVEKITGKTGLSNYEMKEVIHQFFYMSEISPVQEIENYKLETYSNEQSIVKETSINSFLLILTIINSIVLIFVLFKLYKTSKK